MIIKNELLAGVAIAIASFIWICLEYIIGFHDSLIDYHMYVTNLAYVLPVIGLYWAIKKRYATFQPGQFQLKDGLMSGVLVSVTAAVLNLPLQLFFVRYINPDFFGNMIAAEAKKAIMDGGNSIVAITDAQEYYTESSYLIQGFTGFLILGLFISLMLSFRLLKKDSQKIK
ncbi:DUF4199 domain-containing protein [Cytophaga hutchinsonii]|jgi:hypothetical protein|uniref:DUF4199 domain-containing protein n=1 Tax=Cytophaga hutchinsonii (strain ATCC 33406 / DSM 1761 / CIP 103989 / NBRC 15051 / NCIMB 9469 / D465) TaxID=269798 RepID=A0A6N4SSC4_CYTH3|nr:DUF4199 domain-containing protein [Cytophaga hutchinsonii]ABG59272.1 hypothetical protein CHU_2006 [Cytophaga hutchinsonii ATCC 33406]SFX32888.1 Protein of unknown function [Cytophaga hutchinsonii ATCC 33406]